MTVETDLPSDNRPSTYVEETDGGAELVVYRASSVGQCIRALWCSRMGVDPAPPPEWLQKAYDEGARGEGAILELLEEKGWGVSEQQTELEVSVKPGVAIRMHLDCVVGDSTGSQRVCEVKVFADSTYEKWKRHGFAAFPYYAAQCTLQMAATGLPLLFVVGRKTATGEVWGIEEFPTDEPPMKLGAIKAKILRVENWVAKGEMPACDVDQYPCAYYMLHEPKTSAGADGPEKIVDIGLSARELDDTAGRYTVACNIIREQEKIKRELGKQLVGRFTEAKATGGDVAVGSQWRVELVERDMPESVRKAYTQRYVKVDTLENPRGETPDEEDAA